MVASVVQLRERVARTAPASPPGTLPIPDPIAKPAGKPHYVMPGSHKLDPPFAWETPWWPFPRPPRRYETESRAPGTGLIWGSGKHGPPGPQPPWPCPPVPKAG
jgi:hypothetical protein